MMVRAYCQRVGCARVKELPEDSDMKCMCGGPMLVEGARNDRLSPEFTCYRIDNLERQVGVLFDWMIKEQGL